MIVCNLTIVIPALMQLFGFGNDLSPRRDYGLHAKNVSTDLRFRRPSETGDTNADESNSGIQMSTIVICMMPVNDEFEVGLESGSNGGSELPTSTTQLQTIDVEKGESRSTKDAESGQRS